MRRELKWILIGNSVFLLYLFLQVSELLTLLDDNPRELKILEPELVPLEEGTSTKDRPLLIPKIIHQTYKDENIPEKWYNNQQTCIARNPDFKYMFWTDAAARAFIQSHYPWFLQTYDSYKYPIQRVDAVRYFILAEYGGIYVDLDCGCDKPLDTMLTFPAFLRKTDPTGISNDVMGSVPGHPFFLMVLQELEKYNKNWIISYLTVMYSTGPLFLSVMFKKYLKLGSRPGWGDVRVLYPGNKELRTWRYFYDSPGSSWHNGDAKFLQFMNDHIFMTVIMGVGLAVGALYLQYRVYKQLANVGLAKYRIRAYFFIKDLINGREKKRAKMSPEIQLRNQVHDRV